MDLVLLESDTYGTRIRSVIGLRTTCRRPVLFDWIIGMFEKLSSPEFFIVRSMDYSKPLLQLLLEKFGADW